MQTLPSEVIDRLNEEAQRLVNDGLGTTDALERAAHQAGLTLITDKTDTAIYQDENGLIVNCWFDSSFAIEENRTSLEKSALGFDDVVDWYLDSLKVQ